MTAGRMLYRWECRECRKHGRFLVDGNLAQVFASNHADRTGHYAVRIVNNRGRDEGAGL